MSPRRTPDERRRDAGFTLVEVLVAMGLFSIFSAVLLGYAISTADVTEQVRATGDVNGESRLAVERMTREMRQASAVDSVSVRAVETTTQTGTTTSYELTGLTVWVDFDGSGTRTLSSLDPEVLTYRWDPANGRLTLTADDASGTATTRPVLAEVVTRFDLRLDSSLFEADTNADGRTSWQELDASTTFGGNQNGVPDGAELKLIDLVSVRMTIKDADESRDYVLQADLRNRDRS